MFCLFVEHCLSFYYQYLPRNDLHCVRFRILIFPCMLKNVFSLSLILMVGESHWTFISLTSIYITLYLIVQIKFVIPFYSMSLGFVVKVIDFSSPREFIYMVFLNTKLLIFLGLLVIFWICLFQLKIYICSVFS